MQLFFWGAKLAVWGEDDHNFNLCFSDTLVFLRTKHRKLPLAVPAPSGQVLTQNQKYANTDKRKQHSRKNRYVKKNTKKAYPQMQKCQKTHRKESQMMKHGKIVKKSKKTRNPCNTFQKQTTNKHLQTPIKKTVTITWMHVKKHVLDKQQCKTNAKTKTTNPTRYNNRQTENSSNTTQFQPSDLYQRKN